MSNTLLNPTKIARMAIRAFENELVFAPRVFRGYESEWKKDQNGHLPGQSITIKHPMYASVVDGLTTSAEGLKERSSTFSLNNGKNISFDITSLELTYNISEIYERIILPAVRALANQVDSDIAALYKYCPNQVGFPGTTPSAFLTIAQAAQYLNEMGVPLEDRTLVLNPAAHANLADNLKGLFLQGRVNDMISKGYISSDLAGMMVFNSNNIQNHTVGTWGGSSAVLVDDTVADGDATINLDQGGAGSAFTVKQGDIFTIANVNAVNPQTKGNLGRLRQFCVDADATFADAGGGDYNLDITCSPGTAPDQLYETTSYQNVSALPVDDAAVTPVGLSGQVYPVNMAFQRNAIALAMKPLAKLEGGVEYGEASYKGYTISVMKYITGSTRTQHIRFDCLYGVKLLQRDGMVRIAG